MAKIDSNYKYLTYEEMAKDIAEHTLDEVLYDDKSIREWIQIIASEDAVSRQAVIDTIDKWVKSMHVLTVLPANEVTPLFESVHELPPVTPQPKMGKWLIKMVGDYDHAICSVCGDDSFLSPEWDALELYKYCPNCGTKMEMMQE